MAFLKKNILVLALMILVLGGAAYWVTTQGQGSDEPTIVSTGNLGSPTAPDNAELTQRLALLASLSIKRDIFDDPAFKRLQPNLVDVPALTPRNQNPFAPIGQRTDRFATGTVSVPGLSNPVPGLRTGTAAPGAPVSGTSTTPRLPSTSTN